ncbi:MAG: alpha/beta fold hydrolase [Anaerolineales bacterium]|nr:alpha/beta fold hydrolase [Anaerolineales bacterium]
MVVEGLKIFSTVFLGLSVFTIGGSLLGEIVATKAPVFPKEASLSIHNLGIAYEEVAFETSGDLILRGWFFPAEFPNAPAIVYAPATSHDMRSGLSLVFPFHRAGYNVLLFSYRGHGLSDGDPFGFTYGAMESEDVDAAIRYLSETRGIQHIGAIGHSAGAASIILSAARNPNIDAVVAVAPYAAIEEVWETNRPAVIPKALLDLTMKVSELRKGFTRGQVRPEDVIEQIAPRPLLLIHGMEDKRITQAQAMRLFEAAEGPKQFWLVEGVDHEGVRSQGVEDLIDNVIGFFDESMQKHNYVKDTPTREVVIF